MNKLAAAAALLLAGTVNSFAADLPVKARPYAAPEVWNWTGAYIGGHVGAGWGTTESTLTSLTDPAGGGTIAFNLPFSQNSRSGFLGGGQIGFNWQSGWAVFGVQGDVSALGVKGTTPCLVVLSCTAESNWLATATGRVGAVVADRGLIYVKGGGAWLNSTHSVSIPGAGGAGGPLPLPPGAAGALASQDSTVWGWTVGMGLEFMVTRNWTAFVEYNYLDFQKKSEAFSLAGGAAIINADLTNKLSTAKVGVNYKF